jgi:hypothetical protein
MLSALEPSCPVANGNKANGSALLAGNTLSRRSALACLVFHSCAHTIISYIIASCQQLSNGGAILRFSLTEVTGSDSVVEELDELLKIVAGVTQDKR